MEEDVTLTEPQFADSLRMSDLESHLAPVLLYRRPPAGLAPSRAMGYECPKGLAKLLGVADGFITTHGFFRVFGFGGDDRLPSLEDWNRAEWKQAYGPLARGIAFIAEDVFGDQYGYDFRSRRQFVKFYCEGGQIEPIEGGINWFIEALIDPLGLGGLDRELVEVARLNGRWPTDKEHLAFKLPLIAGGKRDASNLGVETAALHLGILAQMSSRNLKEADGTHIARFTCLDGSASTP